MIPQTELTAHDIQETMQTVSQEHLPLEANGYRCTSEMLYDILMKAACENISIDAACRDLEQSASGNRIREHLNVFLRTYTESPSKVVRSPLEESDNGDNRDDSQLQAIPDAARGAPQ